MPCLIVLIALIAPRLVIVLLFFFTTWFEGMFANLLWPILGFFFLPTTLLWYSVVQNVYDGVWGGLQIVVLILAVIIDGSPASAKRGARA
jgi:hypothetical protein